MIGLNDGSMALARAPLFEFARWLGTTPPSMAIKTIPWLPQLLQVVHLLTAGIVLGSMVLLTLRLHGLALGGQSCRQAWSRYSRWLWSALAVMAITGLAFILGEPLREFSALSFWLKLLLLAAATCGALWLGRQVSRRADLEPSPGMRRVALAVLAAWILVGVLGRFIGYDIPVWGALSPRSHL